MPFIAPMLCTRMTDPARLRDPRFVAEAKVDGMRVQVHVGSGRASQCYSRRALDQSWRPGLWWLADLSWPVEDAVLDGELFTGTGCEGIDAVLAGRDRCGGLALALFDLLRIDGRDVMDEPWERRQERLTAVVHRLADCRVQLVPTSDDAPSLWRGWVESYGGEGLVLKERTAVYRPGIRSSAWQKISQRVTVEVDVCECEDRLVEWGDWAHAALITGTYWHPSRRELVTLRQAVRVPNPADWRTRSGLAEVLCWGLRPSGLLRHPAFVRWRDAAS